MTAAPKPKRESQMRWQQARHLYNSVSPSLPTSSHVAVLMYCWFHARGENCEFNVAHCQVANATKLSYERARKIMAELVAGNVVVTVAASKGRGYAPHRRITGKPFTPKKGGHPRPPKPEEGGHP
jgi:hypothetical protein